MHSCTYKSLQSRASLPPLCLFPGVISQKQSGLFFLCSTPDPMLLPLATEHAIPLANQCKSHMCAVLLYETCPPLGDYLEILQLGTK